VARARPQPRSGRDGPLADIRVVDFTAFWAGPAGTGMLAALGADVVKIESTARPDGMRFTSTRPPTVDQWWEWGPIFNAVNANKRSVTLDLNRTEGVELVLRLLAGADAALENFTPRVMENFGLSWDTVRAANPRLVMVRMPGFGLDGPWRDRTGFAQTMEQVSGMAAVTGFPDSPPLIPRGACDPMAGMHAVFALLAALRQRERDGQGRLVEVTMVEAALNAAAEAVVEYSASGRLLTRDGNRGPVASPQGVFRCEDDGADERWVAVAVTDDGQWDSLAKLMDLRGPRPASGEAGVDAVEQAMAAWCSGRSAAGVADDLLAAGVPAAVVMNPGDIDRLGAFEGRRFVETVDHPVVGSHPIPGVPFRFASRGDRPWFRTPAPTLGQHNEEVLCGELGLAPDALARLVAEDVVGRRPRGA
jgi:crotonobetainyl-CoA:carnitine CoA-transferase CaiB-like acyl-CoA transferase